jgi:hypothetical protein
MKVYGILGALIGGLALLQGCGDIGTKLTAPNDIAVVTALGSTESASIAFDAVQYDRSVPGAIIPCVSVLRGLRTAALAGDKFLITYSISYLSGGVLVTQTVTTRLSGAEEHPHDSRLDLAKYIELSDQIDVSGQLPDDGTTFIGVATLSIELGGSRTTVGQSSLGGQ